MRTAITVFRWLVRVSGLVLLVLGTLFWTGNATGLIPLHRVLGFVLVFSLWALAALAARAGVGRSAVWLAVAWGLVVPIVGLTQDQLLVGSAHWLIRVLHLLLGVGAMGQAERLAILSGQRLAPPAAASSA
jgi:hypothetical protein